MDIIAVCIVLLLAALVRAEGKEDKKMNKTVFVVKYTCPNSPLIFKEKIFYNQIHAIVFLTKLQKTYGVGNYTAILSERIS
jgi:hypothetical protein